MRGYIRWIKLGILCVVFFALYVYIGGLMHDDLSLTVRAEYFIATALFGILMFLIDMIGKKFRKRQSDKSDSNIS